MNTVLAAAAASTSHLTWPDVFGILAFFAGTALIIFVFLRWLD